ncbi:lantibiotic dehydratase C-terminal domain-containing protein [Mycobacterium adipatum]|uniref:lantibiotic dehydratase C-terminal domain-containing protein n=1 Tax=Mycobacterium adipatum TaxID=1682113 RepID=UPI003AAA8921
MNEGINRSRLRDCDRNIRRELEQLGNACADRYVFSRVLTSLFHMHCNRLFVADPVGDELIAYSVLRRQRQSEHAINQALEDVIK